MIVRKITVPMMTNEELEEQIDWEAEQHIPFDIKVMSIDYEVLRRRPEAGQMDLLLVAAKKDEINDYAAILREAKLKPVVVDINAFTIQNIFEHQHGLPADGTIALLNVGAAVSSLNIVSKGVSAFTREITNAGNAITEEIQKQCNVPLRAGRGLQERRRPDADRPAGSAPDRPARRATALAGEIQRSLDFYLATSGEKEIGRIYVSRRERVPRAARASDREARARAGAALRPDGEPRRRPEVRRTSSACAPRRADRRRARARRFVATRSAANDPHQSHSREAATLPRRAAVDRAEARSGCSASSARSF